MKDLNTKTIDIVIGGDLIPDDNLLNAFGNAKNGLLECPVYDAICDADLSIVNLECPVIEKQSGIIKSGPVIALRQICLRYSTLLIFSALQIIILWTMALRALSLLLMQFNQLVVLLLVLVKTQILH